MCKFNGFHIHSHRTDIVFEKGMTTLLRFRRELEELTQRKVALESTRDAQARDPALLARVDAEVSRDAADIKEAKADFARLAPHYEHLSARREWE